MPTDCNSTHAQERISVGEPPEPAAPLSPLPAEPLVSIVVPCRNPGARLEYALHTLRRQTYPHLEVIIKDGASTDGTAERLTQLCEPNWRWRSEPDAGQSDAISRGFAAARGQILTWLNADDALLPGAVETWVRLLQHERRPALAYGGCFEWFEDPGWMVPAPWVQPPDFSVLRDERDYIMQPAAAFRADALHAVGGLDAALHYAMDWDLWLKLSRSWPTIHTPGPLAMNRVHAETKTRTGGRARMREIRAVGRRHGRPRLSPADWRYGLVSASESSPALRLMRSWYKNARLRRPSADGAGAPARFSPGRIQALPLSQPRRLWVCCRGDETQVRLELQGRCPSRYTVTLDGEPVELRLTAGLGRAAVTPRDVVYRQIDLPALPGVRLRKVAFSKESEHRV